MTTMRHGMSRRSLRVLGAAGILVLAGILGGCGEKIDMPEAEGLFSVNAYLAENNMVFADAELTGLAVINNNLFLTTADGALVKQTIEFEELARVDGLAAPTALCRDETSSLVFVWEQDARRMGVYTTDDLTPVVVDELPDVQRGTALTASSRGIELEDGARTYLYVADPDSGVVHRYVYYDGDGFYQAGILCRDDGDGARFVHVPAGMATDHEDNLLVCDADTLRNWVIRFDPTPQLDDVTPAPDDIDPWRGVAVLFGTATCEPPAAVDYVLGDAPECGETSWAGAPSAAEGEFHSPVAATIDGSGRIYVADRDNDRMQIFSPYGIYEMVYGTGDSTPRPAGIAVVDWRTGSAATDFNYGAYLFMILGENRELRRFISYDQYQYINEEPPPPPN